MSSPTKQAERTNATGNKEMATASVQIWEVELVKIPGHKSVQMVGGLKMLSSVVCRKGGSNNKQQKDHWIKNYEACTKNLIQKLTS